MSYHDRGSIDHILNSVFKKLAWKLGIPDLHDPVWCACFGET